MGGDHRVDEHIGQGPRVALTGDGDGVAETMGRYGLGAVQELVAQPRERVIPECAASGGGIVPPSHPAGGAQAQKTLPHTTLARERLGKRLAHAKNLGRRQWTAVEGDEEVDIPRSDEGQRACHGSGAQPTMSPFIRPPLRLAMSAEKKSFVNVDELMPQVRLADAARYYGVPLPELRRVGAETRARCFLQCGRTTETGDRALAIQEGEPTTKWKCHQYGCDKGGNLVSLCDLLKPGANAGGKPRGERFKEIAKDMQRMVAGEVPEASLAVGAAAAPPAWEVRENVPLARSDNERAAAS